MFCHSCWSGSMCPAWSLFAALFRRGLSAIIAWQSPAASCCSWNTVRALAHSFLDQSGIFLLILLQCFFPSKQKVFVHISAYACYQSQEASFFMQLQHTLHLFLTLQSSAADCCFVSFFDFNRWLPLISPLVTGSIERWQNMIWHIRDELQLSLIVYIVKE